MFSKASKRVSMSELTCKMKACDDGGNSFWPQQPQKLVFCQGRLLLWKYIGRRQKSTFLIPLKAIEEKKIISFVHYPSRGDSRTFKVCPCLSKHQPPLTSSLSKKEAGLIAFIGFKMKLTKAQLAWFYEELLLTNVKWPKYTDFGTWDFFLSVVLCAWVGRKESTYTGSYSSPVQGLQPAHFP